jgi:hypothetical protein
MSPKSANRGQKRARVDSQDVTEKETTRKYEVHSHVFIDF